MMSYRQYFLVPPLNVVKKTRALLAQSGILGYWSFFLGYWDIAYLKLGYWDIHDQFGISGYWSYRNWDIRKLVSFLFDLGSR